jgi:hypothetical protein
MTGSSRIPTLLALIYLFVRIEPVILAWAFPASATKRCVIAFLTAFVIFGFYGAVGLIEGGPIAHGLSMISICICLPLMAVLGTKLEQIQATSASL